MDSRERNHQRMAYEGVIIYQLNNIVEALKPKDNSNTYLVDLSRAQALYNKPVESIIRKGLTQAYDLGADYTDSQMGFFGVTEEEIAQEAEIVNRLTTEYSSKFWRKVSKLIGRNDVLLQDYDYEPRSPLNSNYMATSTAIGLITRGMALGTINKTKLLQARLKGAAKPHTLEEGERDETHDQFLWSAIMDDATCTVCEDLDGTFFDVDDPDMPEPAAACLGGDNCRCTIEVEPATSAIIYSIEEDDLEE